MDQKAPTSPVPAAAESTTANEICSSFNKTVVLNDWWLVKSEVSCNGKRLAVGGLTSKGQYARVFNSAPIVKRFDAYTLETADGITVMIYGLINRGRTESNGFPSEASTHFLIGFPYNWDSCANKYFGEESSSENGLGIASDDACASAENFSRSFPIRMDKFPSDTILNFLKLKNQWYAEGQGGNGKNASPPAGQWPTDEKSCPTLPTRVADENFCCTSGSDNQEDDRTESLVASKNPIGKKEDNFVEENTPADKGLAATTLMKNTQNIIQDMGHDPSVQVGNHEEAMNGMQKITLLPHTEAAKENKNGVPTESCIECITADTCTKNPMQIINYLDNIPNVPCDLTDNSRVNIKDVGLRDRSSILLQKESCNSYLKDVTAHPVSSKAKISKSPESSPTDSLEKPATKPDPIRKENGHTLALCYSSNNEILTFSSSALSPGCHDMTCEPTESRGIGNLSSDKTSFSEISDINSDKITSNLETTGKTEKSSSHVLEAGSSRARGTPSFLKGGIKLSKAKNKYAMLRRSKRLLNSNLMSENDLKIPKNNCASIAETCGSEGVVDANEKNSSCSIVHVNMELLSVVDSDDKLNSNISDRDSHNPELSSNKSKYENSKSNENVGDETATEERNLHNLLSKDQRKSSSDCIEEKDKLVTDKSKTVTGVKRELLTPVVESKVKKTRDPNTTGKIQGSNYKASYRSPKRRKSTNPSYMMQGPIMQDSARKSFASPELLQLRRSRSGRVLVPRLDSGCQQIIYDSDGAIAGIMTDKDNFGSPIIGTQSEPPKKKNRGLH